MNKSKGCEVDLRPRRKYYSRASSFQAWENLCSPRRVFTTWALIMGQFHPPRSMYQEQVHWAQGQVQLCSKSPNLPNRQYNPTVNCYFHLQYSYLIFPFLVSFFFQSFYFSLGLSSMIVFLLKERKSMCKRKLLSLDVEEAFLRTSHVYLLFNNIQNFSAPWGRILEVILFGLKAPTTRQILLHH